MHVLLHALSANLVLEWLILVADQAHHVDALLAGNAEKDLVLLSLMLCRLDLRNTKTLAVLLLLGTHLIVSPDCILKIGLQPAALSLHELPVLDDLPPRVPLADGLPGHAHSLIDELHGLRDRRHVRLS